MSTMDSEILKKLEGKTLSLVYYDKESDQHVMVFDDGKAAILVEEVNEISEPMEFFKTTLGIELNYAKDILKLENIVMRASEPKQQESKDEQAGSDQV